MNYKHFNEMIDYIENHLTEEINYIKLAKIMGMSEYNLQRIFSFLTNMSLSEYIRKRRLSKAFEELKTTDIKIIDLAIKYNYNSAISFGRAFKKMFNMTPKECRENNKNFKLFPIIEFQNKPYNEVEYKIELLEEKILYCYEVKAEKHNDLLYKIRKIYNDLQNTDIKKIFTQKGMYGIFIYDNNEYRYYVGSETKLDNMIKITIQKGKYAVFICQDDQNDIVKTYNFVYNEWTKSTNYKLQNNPGIELYKDNKCYIYFKIEDKQN